MNQKFANWVSLPAGITAPQGFKATGVASQVRKKGCLDLALIYSETLAVASGVFTQNIVKAAPVILSQEHLTDGKAQAIVCNSGIANTLMGSLGIAHAQRMAEVVSEVLDIPASNVIVSSTGLIGRTLPIDKIESGIRAAASILSRDGGAAAAEAIMTTDTYPKEYALQFSLTEDCTEATRKNCKGVTYHNVTIGGIAKGSGMIHPSMATLLSFLTTDASIDQDALNASLRYAVDRSFNAVSIDGDTSTNDMVVILANGMSRNKLIVQGTPEYIQFRDALTSLCMKLARMVAYDGEGATKFMEVRVKGAQNETGARLIARSIASSNLVKTALFGGNANWGRIIVAAGYAGIPFETSRLTIWIGDLKVVEGGNRLDFDEEKAKLILDEWKLIIIVDLNQGNDEGMAWGCDLSYEYVRINASNRT